jgi:PAS domain-containing protein
MEMSEELYVILGLDPQEGPPPFDPEGSMIHPDDIDYVKDTIQNSLKKGNPYSLDYRIYRKNDGSLRHLHVETQVDDESSQGDLIIYGTVQDITDRKKTADALHASENRYRTLFEHSVEGISILDVQNISMSIKPGKGCSAIPKTRSSVKHPMSSHPPFNLMDKFLRL